MIVSENFNMKKCGEKIDHQIDQLVYKVYGITEKEQRIIENLQWHFRFKISSKITSWISFRNSVIPDDSFIWRAEEDRCNQYVQRSSCINVVWTEERKSHCNYETVWSTFKTVPSCMKRPEDKISKFPILQNFFNL